MSHARRISKLSAPFALLLLSACAHVPHIERTLPPLPDALDKRMVTPPGARVVHYTLDGRIDRVGIDGGSLGFE